MIQNKNFPDVISIQNPFLQVTLILFFAANRCTGNLSTCGADYTLKLRPKEALIKSLSAFILEFLCNARNGTTRIASYLRSPMTKQCIKILIKADSMN
ncbi:hypothetical protein [uncultured Dialister sp.]|uniref:hypothetical protein n=3 Tax=Dialister TaxID=39948 RepID=UPI0025E252A6|nr:hypothetical protein [uncultured Dialister sp.]